MLLLRRPRTTRRPLRPAVLPVAIVAVAVLRMVVVAASAAAEVVAAHPTAEEAVVVEVAAEATSKLRTNLETVLRFCNLNQEEPRAMTHVALLFCRKDETERLRADRYIMWIARA